MMFAVASLFAVAIQLAGVTGNDLRARAFFDANNVTVGDPLVLTIDFVGTAEFRDLHPPALARRVPKTDWKVDDVSAKTDTYRDARRLTYRVRPMREGVLWFPSLEFAYVGPDGAERIVRANEIPVHAKVGAQVVVAGMGEDLNEMPKPPELIREVASANDDQAFAWRKALARPTAEAFAAFDFSEAKLNEATMAIREGNWSRALDVYRKLEWRIGQTPEIERGLIAALALKADNPAVELPVWRTVLRPVLRHAWPLRLALVVGGLALVALLFWLAGRGVKALAALALICLFAAPVGAETIETVTTNADGSVVRRIVSSGGNGNFSFSFSSSSSTGSKGGLGIQPANFFEEFENFDPFGRRRRPVKHDPVTIGVSLAADKPSVMIGEDFNLVLTLDVPRTVSFDEGVRLSIAEQDKMTQVGGGQSLRNAPSANPTNILQRLVFPMRATAAFTNLHYSVEGAYVFANDSSFFFRQSYPFRSGRREASFIVGPLPEAEKPADFSGIIAKTVGLYEYCDLLTVETNDVITITYKLRPNGFVPDAFLPKDVAFEWSRKNASDGRLAEIEYKRYFVANGVPETPKLEISYFDPDTRRYKTVTAGGTRLVYK